MGIELFILHWLYIHTGIPGVGAYYGFWSGIGSDIGELTIVVALCTAIGTFLHRHNCEVKGCWRLQRHATAAGHIVCRKHHPDGPLTSEAVAEAHNAAISNS